MSPGGAIFFLPTNPKENPLSCPVSRQPLTHVATLRQLCRIATQGGPRMVMISQVAGFSRLLQTGGVRTRWVSTGLARGEGRRQSSQPTIASHRVPVLHQVWGPRVTGPGATQKRDPERAREWVGGVVPGDPSAAGPLRSPGVPRCLRGVEVRRALRGQWLTGLGAHHKSKWLCDSVTQKQVVTSPERGWEGLGEGLSKERVLSREPSSWL